MTTAGANVDRFAERPVAAGGTPAAEWAHWLPGFAALDPAGCPALMVVAPHPDDETLGFGATMATLRARGIAVDVVCVSDGGAAYPDLDQPGRAGLIAARQDELRCAADSLGICEPIQLGLPDGGLAERESEIADALADLLADRPAGSWCAATWRGDGHPDHEAVGRAAAVAAQRRGAVLLEYPVWMWHWAVPGDPVVPWQRAHRIELTETALDRKAAAVRCFASQIGPGPGGVEPVLPDYALRRLDTVGELVFR